MQEMNQKRKTNFKQKNEKLIKKKLLKNVSLFCTTFDFQEDCEQFETFFFWAICAAVLLAFSSNIIVHPIVFVWVLLIVFFLYIHYNQGLCQQMNFWARVRL